MPHALKPVLITPPAEPPVTLDEVKSDRRVDFDDDDADLERYLNAAVAYLDGYRGVLGIALVTQTWRQDFSGFPGDSVLRLPFGPVASVEEVAYRDADDALQTLSASVYAGPFEDNLGPFLSLKSGQSWPATFDRPDAVSVTFVAGADPENVPADIREAIIDLVGHQYEHREPVVIGQTVRDLPLSVKDVVDAHRDRL